MATSISHTIRFSHDLQVSKSSSISITRLLSGTLEMSALYRFQFLVEVAWAPDTTGTDCSTSIATLLGQRVHVAVMAAGTTADAQGSGETATMEENAFQHIHGIIMSIESTTAYGKAGPSKSTYILTVRPELAKACYSRNRTVHTAATCAELLTNLAERWNTVLVLCGDAEKRLPQFLQLRQNDESDYNFLTRILASCGLGYYWVMPDSSSQTQPKDREYLCVFDATSPNKERNDNGDTHFGTELAPTSIMVPVSQSSSLWKLNYGFQNLTAEEVQVGNYNAPTSSQATFPGKAPKVSLHDETWDQCIQGSLAGDKIKSIYQSSHNNASTCHGMFLLGSTDAEFSSKISQAGKLHIGGKITWNSATTADAAQYGSDTSSPFYITKLSIDATDKTWRAIIDGRNPGKDAGLGVLPRPVSLNNRPDLDADDLITGAPWPEPRMRLFLAIVEDGSTYSAPNSETSTSPLTTRNLCKVREIAQTDIGSGKTTNTATNTLWVELGSPFADNDSGLLTRPRKGNVLVCLDRGDLSIPLAISSLFRDNNAVPFASLQTMDRHTCANTDDTIDLTTVTLRNRVQLPPRSYSEDSTHSDIPIDLAPKETHITRPLSVTRLAENPLPFSQIQLVSRDNGTKPIPHNNDITNTYLSSSIIETVAGTVSDTDAGGNYVMANAAKNAQSLQNAPIARPHFEGVNIYSSCDVLLQSADHQIINAGGEIVITADKGITLRVGKSSVKITEAGIEIVSATGKVINPGAYPASTDKTTAQQTHLMNDAAYPVSGSLVVDSSGVILKGPYIANTATNSFKASTILGSVFTLSDFNAKLFAPQTSIIGGAALDSTVTSLLPTLLKGIPDIVDTSLGRDFIYTGPLRDCGKTTAPNLTSFAGSALASASKSISTVLGAIDILGGGISSLFSITGSMLKLQPESMSISSQTINEYFMHLYEICNPAAGFLAMAERSSRTSVLKKAPSFLAINSSNMADALFLIDVWRMSETSAGKNEKSEKLKKLPEQQNDYIKKKTNYEAKQQERITKQQSGASDEEIQAALKAEQEAHAEMLSALKKIETFIDLFTKLDAPLPTPQYSGASIGNFFGALITGGLLYAGEQILLTRILKNPYVWNKLANALYLGKREVLAGLEDVKALAATETALKTQQSALSHEENAVDSEEHAGEKEEEAIYEHTEATTTTTTTVRQEQQEVSLKSTVASEEKTFAQSQVLGVSGDEKKTIITHTGPVLNN